MIYPKENCLKLTGISYRNKSKGTTYNWAKKILSVQPNGPVSFQDMGWLICLERTTQSPVYNDPAPSGT